MLNDPGAGACLEMARQCPPRRSAVWPRRSAVSSTVVSSQAWSSAADPLLPLKDWRGRHWPDRGDRKVCRGDLLRWRSRVDGGQRAVGVPEV